MNSNFKRIVFVCTAVLLAVTFSHVTFARSFSTGRDKALQPFHRDMHHPPMSSLALWRNPEIVKNLKLTDDQLSKMKEADFAYREKKQKLRAEMALINLKMEKAFSEKQVDEAVVSECARKIADLRGKLFILNIESRLMVGRLLTADQKKKLWEEGHPPFAGKRGKPFSWGPPMKQWQHCE